MVESLHHLIDQLTGILLALLGEVEIDHGGFELGMAHVSLDDPQVDSGFEKMGGIGVAQGVNGDRLFFGFLQQPWPDGRRPGHCSWPWETERPLLHYRFGQGPGRGGEDGGG